MVPLRPVRYGLALGALGIAFHLSEPPARGRAAPPSPPTLSPPLPAWRTLVTRAGPSCPLSVGEQVAAVKAFARMTPTFRHPRCINCHGALDIYSSNHKGASDLDPNLGRMTHFVQWRAQCQDCHDVLPRSPTTGDTASGWITPPPSLFFVDPATGAPKSDEELCVQMKEHEPTGSKLVSHLHDDHGGVQFIAAGYVGDRALGPQGLKDHSVVVQPPPGTQAELTQMARDWLATMGGDYVGDAECGCAMPKIKLQIHHHSADNMGDAGTAIGFADFSGTADFEVALTLLEGPGPWYRGEKTLVRPLQATFKAQGCRATASQEEEWTFAARVDTSTNLMTLKFTMTPSEEQGSVTCTTRGYVDTKPLRPSIFAGIEEIVMPLDSGATKTETMTAPEKKAQETMRVTVLVVPGK